MKFRRATAMLPPPLRGGGLGWGRTPGTISALHTPIPAFPRVAGEGAKP